MEPSETETAAGRELYEMHCDRYHLFGRHWGLSLRSSIVVQIVVVVV